MGRTTWLVIAAAGSALALTGQWLRLPSNVGSDVLCLDLEADPLRRLVETDETDNATSVAFRVDGTRIRKANSAAGR